jgi:pyruvate dehydrogenase E2 component (dihydrolipoamide acetyltransferase)
MPIKILMPALSPTMTEGNLAKWHKQAGDSVAAGELLAEIETDKATMEIEAVEEGRIGKILIAEGTQNVSVGSVIALLLEEGEDNDSLLSTLNSSDEPSKTSSSSDNLQTSNEQDVKACINSSKIHDKSRIFVSPLARVIANQKGVNLSEIKGSGPLGRIVKNDVLNFSQKISSDRTTNKNETTDRLIPNSNIRKIIAKRLQESKQTIPHFYLSIECIVDDLLKARQEINSSFGEIKQNKISVNDFIILASAKSLKEVWQANASWQEEAICYYHNVDVSVAVAIDGGLITPVIRNADQKSLFELSAEMKILAEKAKKNSLMPEEFQGGGFTISNLGMYGIKNFQAIINPPQSCIIAIGTSTKKPIILNDQFSSATIMEVTLSCDHRVVDGIIGAKFLSAFKKYLENPVLMLV